MYYIKIPYNLDTANLSHAELSVLFQLCVTCFRFAQGRGNKEFYCTDRTLATWACCSTRTVFMAKKKLKALKLIHYFVGPGNKTWYKIIGLIQ